MTTPLQTAAQHALDLLVDSDAVSYIEDEIGRYLIDLGENYKPHRLASMRGDKERVEMAIEALREALKEQA